VIRNVVIHIANEQPLLADLFDLPTAVDTGLLCTNLRALDGKRPVFIDHIESTFFFPYRAIRFLEMPGGAVEGHAADAGRDEPSAAVGRGDAVGAETPPSASMLPAVVEPAADEDLDEEIDEDFLRRIRDI
jgi:hypothetical protein